MKRRLNVIIVGVITGLFLIAGSLWSVAERTLPQSDKVCERLELQGYTDITITGWDWLAADEIWRPATGFVATDSTGQRCVGAVVVDSDGVTRIRFAN